MTCNDLRWTDSQIDTCDGLYERQQAVTYSGTESTVIAYKEPRANVTYRGACCQLNCPIELQFCSMSVDSLQLHTNTLHTNTLHTNMLHATYQHATHQHATHQHATHTNTLHYIPTRYTPTRYVPTLNVFVTDNFTAHSPHTCTHQLHNSGNRDSAHTLCKYFNSSHFQLIL
jgi:hypothetical protein